MHESQDNAADSVGLMNQGTGLPFFVVSGIILCYDGINREREVGE